MLFEARIQQVDVNHLVGVDTLISFSEGDTALQKYRQGLSLAQEMRNPNVGSLADAVVMARGEIQADTYDDLTTLGLINGIYERRRTIQAQSVQGERNV